MLFLKKIRVPNFLLFVDVNANVELSIANAGDSCTVGNYANFVCLNEGRIATPFTLNNAFCKSRDI